MILGLPQKEKTDKSGEIKSAGTKSGSTALTAGGGVFEAFEDEKGLVL